MSHTTEVMSIFVRFSHIFTKTSLLWQRSLNLWSQECRLWIGRPGKPPVLSIHTVASSRRNAIFVPKLVAMVTPLCPLCTTTVVSQMNSLIAETLSQNQTLHRYVTYNWSYGHFCQICCYFGQHLVAMATSLDPCNQKYLQHSCALLSRLKFWAMFLRHLVP